MNAVLYNDFGESSYEGIRNYKMEVDHISILLVQHALSINDIREHLMT